MITPVICEVRSQAESVRRLQAYCKELDGTEIKVIQLSPEDDAKFIPECAVNAKACRAAFSLHHCAEVMKGQPFIWMEHDSIPLKAGWSEQITAEYKRLKKPFMLSSDSHPPFDKVGGIGVYGPDTHWMIPTQISYKPGTNEGSGWDLWMIRNIPQLISRTALIQHSYGNYDAKGKASPHEFPRDAQILRSDAVIFHRDATQSLMRPDSRTVPNRVFYHSGDLGDIVYSLPAIRELGGGILGLGSNMGFQFRSRCREQMSQARHDLISPLLLAQRYISGTFFHPGNPEPSWINLNRFREIFKGCKGPTCQSLQRGVLRRFGVRVQNECQPWLTPNSTEQSSPIVVARSPRYHNDAFPWARIMDAYRGQIVFVGNKDDASHFSGEFEWVKTDNLLDVSKVISGAKVFIGNQSCPYAIAEGLKKPCVQETWMEEPNCLFHRPNVLNMTTEFDRISKFIDSYLGS